MFGSRGVFLQERAFQPLHCYLCNDRGAIKITNPLYINKRVSYELTFIQIIDRDILSYYKRNESFHS